MMEVSRRSMLAGSIVAGAALSLGGCARSPQRLLATDSNADGFPTVEGLKVFARSLEERTDGRLQVAIYPSEQLGSQNDTIELAQFGGVDFVRINAAPLNVLVPETRVPSLPFLFRSTAHMRAALDGAPGRQILAGLEAHGLVGLAFYDSGARSIYTRDREVRTPQDMRGLKIRVQPSDLFVSMIAAMGANATPMAYGEVFQGIIQGVIDGAENNFPSYESTRHFDAAPFYSMTQHVMAPEILAISGRRWKQLSTADKQHVRDAAEFSVPAMRAVWDAQVIASREIVEKGGATIVEDVDHESFSSRMNPVWEQYADTPALRRLVDDILAISVSDV